MRDTSNEEVDRKFGEAKSSTQLFAFYYSRLQDGESTNTLKTTQAFLENSKKQIEELNKIIKEQDEN